MGEGVQRAKAHWIIRLSGQCVLSSQSWLESGVPLSVWSCSRVDIQLTVPYESDVSELASEFKTWNER